jgi:hypothetical protein
MIDLSRPHFTKTEIIDDDEQVDEQVDELDEHDEHDEVDEQADYANEVNDIRDMTGHGEDIIEQSREYVNEQEVFSSKLSENAIKNLMPFRT